MADESEGERLRVKLAVMALGPPCAGGAARVWTWSCSHHDISVYVCLEEFQR